MPLKEVLNKVKELSKELDQLRPISPEQERRIMEKFRLDWNYNSNHIEGNQLTYGETKALLLYGITAQGKTLKDHIEIQGHDEAIKYIEEVIKQNRPFTEHFVRELHQMILKEPYEVDAQTPDGKPTKRLIQIGRYKTTPNHVLTKTGEIFRFATPEETPAMMNDLISWLRDELANEDTDAVLLAAEFHYRFIRIHPFDDGNGRLVRILMNFIFMIKGYPPVIIKSEKKDEYYSALRQADSGSLEIFFEYIALQLIRSLELMVRGAKGEPVEEPGDLEKELTLLKERIKNEDEIQFDKNPETIVRMYELSFRPLFEAIHNKLKQFDELFSGKSENCRTGIIRISTGNFLDDLDKGFADYKALYLRSSNELSAHEKKMLDLTGIEYRCVWTDFKKNYSFNIGVGLRIKLDKMHYILSSMEVSKFNPIKKSYSEIVSEDEIKEIANILARHVLDSIKKRIVS